MYASEPLRLGHVQFPASCGPAVQQPFSAGVALLHSFQYVEATKAFHDIAQRDPQCAMAYWGLAMSLYQQLWKWPTVSDLRKGREYSLEAQKLRGNGERERGYIASVVAFYREEPGLSRVARIESFSKTLQKLYERNPTDVNAGAFYALSLVALAQAGVDNLGNRKRAITVLDKLFATDPDNPGVDHYLIHAADTPQLAAEGLRAARHYAKIAPDSAHALHMPSHIVTRLGLWQESITSNLASAAAAERATRSHEDDEFGYEVHALQFLEYTYLQSGESKKALAVIARVKSLPGDTAPDPALDLTEIQGSLRITYVMKNHDWKAASELELPSEDPYPEDKRNLYWARTIGDARTGNVTEAQQNLAQLRKVCSGTHAGKHAPNCAPYLSETEAWLDYAEGRLAEAVRTMRAAASNDDPAAIDNLAIPVEEMLGDLLLDAHRPALDAYKVALKESPNRFDALYGAARAAEAEVKVTEAKTYYRQLLKLCGPASDRREISKAEAYLAKVH